VSVERVRVQEDSGLALLKEPNHASGVVLRRCLGEDSLYESWLAEWSEPGRIPRPQLLRRLRAECATDPRLCEEVRRRAKRASLLEHTSILRITELAPDGEFCGYCADLFDGKTLQQLLSLTSKAGHALPIWFGLEVARQLTRALEHAHERSDDQHRPLGASHGDVSPENIVITVQGLVKLTDFGLSPRALGAIVASGPSSPSVVEATVALPGGLDWEHERARDLEQVGSTLYRLLTGHAPASSFVPPSVHASWLTAELDLLLARLLSSDPPRRIGSAGELGAELEELLRATRHEVTPSHVASLVSLLFVAEGCELPPPTVRSESKLRVARPREGASSARRISGPSIKAVLPHSPAPEGEVETSAPQPSSRRAPASGSSTTPASQSLAAGPSRHDWDAALERVRREQESVRPTADLCASDSRLRIPGLPEDPKRAAALLFERGFEDMHEGRLAEAKANWQRALELDPEHRACRANLKMLQKKFDQ
jgi:eukaryotic-like serine/threonine-protein kinase